MSNEAATLLDAISESVWKNIARTGPPDHPVCLFIVNLGNDEVDVDVFPWNRTQIGNRIKEEIAKKHSLIAIGVVNDAYATPAPPGTNPDLGVPEQGSLKERLEAGDSQIVDAVVTEMIAGGKNGVYGRVTQPYGKEGGYHKLPGCHKVLTPMAEHMEQLITDKVRPTPFVAEAALLFAWVTWEFSDSWDDDEDGWRV